MVTVTRICQLTGKFLDTSHLFSVSQAIVYYQHLFSPSKLVYYFRMDATEPMPTKLPATYRLNSLTKLTNKRRNANNIQIETAQSLTQVSTANNIVVYN